MLEGLGHPREKREPDVVGGGRPHEGPDANQITDEPGLENVEVELTHLLVEGRVVLLRHGIPVRVPEAPDRIGQARDV